MSTNKFSAPMTLVAVRAQFQIGANFQDHKMLHGLVYSGLVKDSTKLKLYCQWLCDQYIRDHIIPSADPDDRITFEMSEWGAVVPDNVTLPFAGCNPQKAAMINMHMVVETNTEILSVPEEFPDIKEVREL